ncbi:alpha/beta hydrolase family protein [Yunchengibacter salinarum]|uniref:alpha/beta hydrolase family protein n=1 Tax=Yunchengibacter salinarum TaxID=3133399 RepID=UPI0035B65983
MRPVLIVLALLIAVRLPALAEEPTRVKPIEDRRPVTGVALLDRLVATPPLSGASLSPDGRFLAAFRPGSKPLQRRYLAVWRVPDSLADTPDDGLWLEDAMLTGFSRHRIHWTGWGGGAKLLIADESGGITLFDADQGQLTPLVAADEGGGERLLPRLLSSLGDDPDHVLVQMADPSKPRFPAVFRLNLKTGARTRLIGAWPPVITWFAAPDGTVALGEGFRGRTRLLYGRSGGGTWRPLAEGDYFADETPVPLGVEAGAATALVLSAKGRDTRALWRMDVSDGSLIQKLAAHDRFDVKAALMDPASHRAVGAIYDADRAEQLVWRDSLRTLIARVARRFHVDQVVKADVSHSGDRHLFRLVNDQGRDGYALVDSAADAASGGGFVMVRIKAAPDPARPLPQVNRRGVWIDLDRYGAGEGEMHAILSTPPGDAPPDRGVVLIHGGPVSRVTLGFEPLVTWLVANGYTVLQPNFRGSSGFGRRWRQAGYRQWGRAMQDDVVAAARYLFDRGHVARGRLCAAGGSYGGYAALMAVVRDRRLFACAASLNGVTSLPHLVNYLDSRRFGALSVPRIQGDWNREQLKDVSPLYLAPRFRRPVLLLHGNRDKVVLPGHSAVMAQALEGARRRVSHVVLDGAGHRLHRADHRRRFYGTLMTFLNRHIGPAGDD